MSLRSISTESQETPDGDGEGDYFERDCRTMPIGYAIKNGDQFIIGCGTTKKEARHNALVAAAHLIEKLIPRS